MNKFTWSYFKNRPPYNQTINDLVAQWVANDHQELLQNKQK